MDALEVRQAKTYKKNNFKVNYPFKEKQNTTLTIQQGAPNEWKIAL